MKSIRKIHNRLWSIQSWAIPLLLFIGMVVGFWELLVFFLLTVTPRGVRLIIFYSEFPSNANIFKNSSFSKSSFYIYFFAMMALYIMAFSGIYRSTGLVCSDTLVTNLGFLHSLYFSITIWSGLGFENCAPTPYGRFWVSIEVLLGYLFLGLLVALLVRTIQLEMRNPR